MTIFFFLILFNTAFQCVQLVIEILKKENTIHDYIPNVTFSASSAASLFVYGRFLLNRKQLWALFNDWRKMENRMMITSKFTCSNHVIKLRNSILSFYFLIFCSFTIFNSFFFSYDPEKSYLLSHYKIVREALGVSFAAVFQGIAFAVGFILASISDLVPGFIFYHGGLILRSFEIEIKSQFYDFNRGKNITLIESSSLFKKGMHEICLRYEIFSKLVKRANKIFGIVMVINHGTALFLVSVQLYSTFYKIRKSHAQSLVHFIAMLMIINSFVVGHLLTAKLHSASVKLRSTLSSMLSQHTIHLDKQELAITSNFLVRLQEDQLAACPLGLYVVTASNLLTFSSLIISYVIILLQA